MSAFLQTELDLALELAAEAAQLATRYRRDDGKHLDTSEKPNAGGLVTAADLAVNQLLVDALRNAFPHDGILAEESDAERDWASHERVWMIDPIDGTREYAMGLSSWAVHIGLSIGGQPALGVVAMPARGRTLWGVIEPHAASAEPFVANGLIDTSAETALTTRPLGPATGPRPAPRLLTSASRHSPRMDALADALDIPESQRSRSGSTGVKMSIVCEGGAELYAHGSGGLKLWDTCAPLAILRACGGDATGLRGEALAHDGSIWRHANGLLAFRNFDGYAAASLVAQRFDNWFDEKGLVRE